MGMGISLLQWAGGMVFVMNLSVCIGAATFIGLHVSYTMA
jgi:hypothetical protein